MEPPIQIKPLAVLQNTLWSGLKLNPPKKKFQK